MGVYKDEIKRFEKELQDLEETESDLLYELKDIAETLANEFKHKMDLLEARIEQALDEVSEETKEELSIYCVEDITQNLDIDTHGEMWEYLDKEN